MCLVIGQHLLNGPYSPQVIVKEKEEKRVHREACSHGDSVDSLRAGSADLEMKAAPMPSIHSRRFRE